MVKISVNQLAKFLVSNSGQHRAIIKAQLEDNVFMGAYYRDAQRAITDFLLDSSRNEEKIAKAINEMDNTTANKDYERARLKNNIEALDSFLIMSDEIQCMEDCQISSISASCPKVIIEDVAISVFPECIIAGNYKSKNICGAVKLYFSKSDILSDEMAATITVLTKKFLEENYPHLGSVRNQLCQVVDVFGRTVYPTPASYIRKINEISAACAEIKFWWNSLQPNANTSSSNSH
jgi:hypothetical protein